ncbi:MAG: WG repeat-containing protein [Zoogloeaceae bacterium]|jgi:hypothetical protein|nr:WG repeat-containing protein [Zoogloeaceae bacterium]
MKRRTGQMAHALRIGAALLLFAASSFARAEEARCAAISWAIAPRYESAWDFADNGLAAVAANGKWGYVDEQGREVVPLRYDTVANFFFGDLAPVEADGKWGYVDAQGKEIVPPRHDGAGHFRRGMANVMKGEKWGYIDKKGEEVIPICFERIQELNANGLTAAKKDGKWGFVRVPPSSLSES